MLYPVSYRDQWSNPIISLFCDVKLSQSDNFGPEYLEKYESNLFIF